MEFQPDPSEIKRASIPHDALLFNLIGNHIVISAALGGMASHDPELMAIVPLISVGVLSYVFWGNARAQKEGVPLFVRCHWNIAARRARFFLMMLGVLGGVIGLASAAHLYAGMMKELAVALVVGGGVLPVMVTVLVLIIMESDILNHAKNGRVPDWAYRRVTGEDPPKVESTEVTDPA